MASFVGWYCTVICVPLLGETLFEIMYRGRRQVSRSGRPLFWRTVGSQYIDVRKITVRLISDKLTKGLGNFGK